MRSDVRAIPEGMHTITPHIVVRDAAHAAEWYASAFGAEERDRLPLPGGKLMYVELWFGDSAVMVADEYPEAGRPVAAEHRGYAGRAPSVHGWGRRALATRPRCGRRGPPPVGGSVLGDRQRQFTDPFGHRWGVTQHLRDVPRDEIARAAAAAFG